MCILLWNNYYIINTQETFIVVYTIMKIITLLHIKKNSILWNITLTIKIEGIKCTKTAINLQEIKEKLKPSALE